MTHARLSPSSSSRWLTCTASVVEAEKYENTTNKAAEWGTVTHGIGELLLKDLEIPKIVEERVWNDEQYECALEYANYVREFITKDSVVLIEEQFNLSSISEGQFGTSDATVLNDTHLHIFDLKTGHNIVNAEENTQMMLYAIGAVDELEMIHDIETITLHIVQTRANHISTWELSYDKLMEFKEYAKQQAQKIISGDTEFNPTEKGCKWCPHQANCEALRTHVENTIKDAFDELEEIEGKADIISDDHIKKVLDNKDLITNFIKAVEQVALERLQNGQEIKGYKLVEARKNKKWVDEGLVAKHLNDNYVGVDHYQHKLLPMSQILKMHKDDKKLQELVIKPRGEAVLAPESDKRESIKKVCDEFDNLS